MKTNLWRWAAILSLSCLAIVGPALWAQHRPLGRPQPPPFIDEPAPASPERNVNRKILKESYQQIQKDAQHLSDLAAELKEDVANSDQDVLSLADVKKAEEIEKLAKKIQSRMKNL